MSPARAPRAGGIIERFRRTSLTVKLTVLGGAVTAVVLFAAFWVLSVQTRRSARAMFTAELNRHQATLLRLQRQNLNQVLASAGLMAQQPTLKYALQTYRVEANLGGGANPLAVRTVEQELVRLLHGSDRDLVLVTNDQGVVFAAAHRNQGQEATLGRGTDLSRMTAIRRALSPAATADSGHFAVFRSGRGAFELVVHPLVLNGYTLGALVLGDRLDDGLVASARAAFDGHVIVTAGTDVIAGTLTDVALPAGLDAASVGGGTTVRLDAREFVVAPLRLGETQQGEAVALWLLQPVDETVRALTAPLRRHFLLYGILAVALAALGASIASRSVLRPFHAFVDYLRSGDVMGATDRRFISEGQPPEIQTLNESFQQLMESINAKRRELVKRTTELTAANAVLSDEIRERERVEHALRERDEQLRQSQKLEAIGTLAGGIAHDFNNLLTAMSGFSQLAMMKTDPQSAVADDLRQILEAANRASHLTRQLLAFSRKQVLRPAILDIGNVIRGIAPLFERLLGDNIKLRVDVADVVPTVLADQGQLEQVLMNLAINARDAMPHGGTLTITARGESIDGVCSAEVCVSDTGVGIPESLRERIFEPFFTTKEPGKGTGLGLSTVYGIVTQSGGRIEVDSSVGRGTTFRIILPAAAEEMLDAQPEGQSAELARGTETVLLVEDEASVRNLARRTLESCGYTVLPASDPIEALRLAETARVDLILSDIRMPHMTGIEMVEQFLLEHPAPVVIFMSGYADETAMADSRSLRSSFVRKPFSPAELASAVREALDASLHTQVIALP